VHAADHDRAAVVVIETLQARWLQSLWLTRVPLATRRERRVSMSVQLAWWRLRRSAAPDGIGTWATIRPERSALPSTDLNAALMPRSSSRSRQWGLVDWHALDA
jgi:hypothetical protein